MGGSANNYDYVNADPINSLDLTGEKPGGGGKPSNPDYTGGLFGDLLKIEIRERAKAALDAPKVMESSRNQDRNGFTRAGRAAQKRSDRNPTGGWPEPAGKKNPAAWNPVGEKLLETMLNNPDKQAFLSRGNIGGRYNDCIDVRMPDGTGYRTDMDGNFEAFLEKYQGPS
ncbi:hypothetical protein ACFWU5_19715 [Nocardia sp. NPDC058640]|uniref:hypothetical protein n=1 Tax=Nocardia sp. NPDC058640 TaxID=3346571 RepID=UPI00364798EE